MNWLLTHTPLLYFTQSLWRDEAFSALVAERPITWIIQSAAFDDAKGDDTKQAKNVKKADDDDDTPPPTDLPSDDFDDEFEIPAFLRQRK